MRWLHWRRSGAKAKVCLLSLLVTLSCEATSRAERLSLAGVELYPASTAGAHAVTVLLHGMCGRPENACGHFESTVTRSEHLVCPRATTACTSGGFSWPQQGYAESIETSVQTALAVLGERADESQGRTLIGYSLGAFRALALAERERGRYPRVLLIGAKVWPNRARLEQAGVERLLLSAGRADMMHDHMRREAKRLDRGGFSAAFLELGRAGHAFDETLQQYLPVALEWLRENQRA